MTQPSAGSYSPRKLFGAIELTGGLTLGRLLWLASLGVGIVLLEQAFRWPLQLPGHHGIEAVALMVLGRLSCNSPWSATVVGAGAAVAAPVLGADHGVLMPLFYLLPGVVLDLGYRLRPVAGAALLFFLPVAGALAWACKPVLRVIAHEAFGMQFGSLRFGPVYPILTHMLFGFIGALAAVLLWRATERAAGRVADR
jgi:hypothetical protein